MVYTFEEKNLNKIEINPNTGLSDKSAVLPWGSAKESPTNLIEELNNSNVPTGATLLILDNNKQNRKIHFVTNNFYLSAMRMAYKEKTQITETFNSSAVSFFGDSVKIYSFAGKMLDFPSYELQETPGITGDIARSPAISDALAAGGQETVYDYSTMSASAFNILYNEELRASKLFKDKRIGLIKIYNHWIWGYPLNFELSYNAGEDKLASFGLTWLVAKHELGMSSFFTESELKNTMLAESFYTKAASKEEKQIARHKERLRNVANIYFQTIENVELETKEQNFWEKLWEGNDENFKNDLEQKLAAEDAPLLTLSEKRSRLGREIGYKLGLSMLRFKNLETAVIELNALLTNPPSPFQLQNFKAEVENANKLVSKIKSLVEALESNPPPTKIFKSFKTTNGETALYLGLIPYNYGPIIFIDEEDTREFLPDLLAKYESFMETLSITV